MSREIKGTHKKDRKNNYKNIFQEKIVNTKHAKERTGTSKDNRER